MLKLTFFKHFLRFFKRLFTTIVDLQINPYNVRGRFCTRIPFIRTDANHKLEFTFSTRYQNRSKTITLLITLFSACFSYDYYIQGKNQRQKRSQERLKNNDNLIPEEFDTNNQQTADHDLFLTQTVSKFW